MTDIVVSLVSSSLLCIVSNHVFDFFLDNFQLDGSQFLRCNDFTCNLVMDFVVLVDHLSFKFTNRRFNDRVCLFNLEISNLTDHWFDFIFNFFHKSSTLNWIEFSRTLRNHHLLEDNLATTWGSHSTCSRGRLSQCRDWC